MDSLVNLQFLVDDARCFETVRRLRWPEGVRCPVLSCPLRIRAQRQMPGQSLARSPLGRPAAHHPKTRIEPGHFTSDNHQSSGSTIKFLGARRRHRYCDVWTGCPVPTSALAFRVRVA